LDSQIKYTRLQGHEVIKVKVRHDLKVTLMIKFIEYSRVVARFQALGFQIPNLKEFLKLDLRDARYCAKTALF